MGKKHFFPVPSNLHALTAQALKYMGYTITPQQQKEMRVSLDVDENGRVVFNEFVKLAQDMFSFKLDESHLESNLMLALTQKEDLDMPPMPTKVRIPISMMSHTIPYCTGYQL